MEEIKKILHEGTDAQRKLLFSFGNLTTTKDIFNKFEIFCRYFYPKFFKSKDAPFHKEAIRRLISVYRGEAHDEFLWIGFRGCSKSTYMKLFTVFVLANDTERTCKYFKILSSDLLNSKQFVTDVYNMLVGDKVKVLYPELFEKTELKRQETMDIIDFATGIKVVAGTVGQNQRGNVQGFEEANRPDFILFDDIETRDSLRSAVKTRAIWDKMNEAIDGRAKNGRMFYLANYISERGNVHRLVEKVKNKLIVPILEDGKPTWDRFTMDDIANMKQKAEDWEGEYLCLKPGTLIYTENGLQSIESIVVGQTVATHMNRFRKVLQVFKSEAEDLLDITVDDKVTTITKNHPVLVERGGVCKWIKAGELTLQDLLIKIHHGKLCI